MPPKQVSPEDTIREIVEAPPKLQRVGDPLIDRFREEIMKRAGRAGFRGLTTMLRRMDDNGDRKLSLAEFRDGITAYQLNYRDEELERLFRYMDRDKSGQVSVTEFVRGIRPDMTMARRDLVLQAFRLIDLNCDGVVRLNELMQLYDVSRHPEVIAGKKTPEEVLTEFMQFWDKDGDKTVTQAEFLDYYTDISAGIDSDVYFELMIRNAWHISGGTGAAANTTCLRVLVIFEDGRQAVTEVRNDLGLKKDDTAAILKRLAKQGVRNIKEIRLAH